jgi:hypothetical protein
MTDDSQDDQLLQVGYQAFNDGLTQGIDYVKHLTTLSAGAIVLIATFLKDIFPQDIGLVLKILIAASFIFFGLSLVSASFLMYHFIRVRRQIEDIVMVLISKLPTTYERSLSFDSEVSGTEEPTSDEATLSPPKNYLGEINLGDMGLLREVTTSWKAMLVMALVPFGSFIVGIGTFGIAVLFNLF